MRSYSSVLCSMIGQHPGVYAFPELNLFVGDTLGEAFGRTQLFAPHGMDGLLRALAELQFGAQSEDTIASAQAWCAERQNWPIGQVFDHLQGLVGDKIIVDKSPATVVNQPAMRRMLALFPDASFLHITRHPRSTCTSILSLMERSAALGINFHQRQIDPESIWLRCHQNIREFSAVVTEGQLVRVKGEMLLGDLDTFLPQVAEWLDLDDEPAMIDAMTHPEQSPYAGIGPANARYGNDPNFLERPALDRQRLAQMREPVLDGPLEWAGRPGFSKETLKLAREFGYG